MQVRIAKLAVGAVKTTAFVIFAHISLDDARAGNILLHDRVHAVKLCLHDTEHRNGFFEYHDHRNKEQRQRPDEHESEIHIEKQKHDRATNEKYRGAHEHTQDGFHKLDKARDVVGHTRDERAGGEFVGLLDRQRHYMAVCVTAQIVAEALRRARRGVSAHGAEKSAHKGYAEHEQTKGDYHLHSGGRVAAKDRNYARGDLRAVFRVVKRDARNSVVDYK